MWIKCGAHTVFSQQRSYFDSIGDDRHPRTIFREDILELINQCISDGDQVILLIDATDNMSDTSVTETALFEAGLREVIIDKHWEQCGISPTHNRGKHPVDGIWVSDSINIEASGYLAMGDAPSDHCGLWIRVKNDILFGYNMQKMVPPSAHCLTLEDPRVVKRWCKIYEAFIRKHRLPQQAYHLQQQIEEGKWNKQLAKEYEKLRRHRLKGIKLADEK